VFEEAGTLFVLDFKTDRELDLAAEKYRRQLNVYCRALADLRGMPARGILMKI
jgi:ATP-dependent exoDNAse (exonuclease V) beta subunit